MNEILVFQPRWHTRDVLIANWKIVNGYNKIKIDYHTFPDAFYMQSTQLWKYPIEEKPTKSGTTAQFRVVPLNDLELSTQQYHIKQTNKDIVKTANEIFNYE